MFLLAGRAAMRSAAVVALAAGPLTAQTTSLPTFVGPLRAFDRSEFETVFGFANGIDWGVELGYWIPIGPFELAIRSGAADPTGPDNAYPFVTADARLHLIGPTWSFPMRFAAVFGVGGVFRDGGQAVASAGLSLGDRIGVGRGVVHFIPFVEPKIVGLVGAGRDRGEFALGLGLDVEFGPRLVGRLHGSLGDLRGVAIGAAWRQ